ncbi:hypothetical protein SAMN02910455_00822 [Acidaminococcus fermentans]|uniref:Uncharacterized protein n=3 Tax=Acidaminococcus fermentans TaxID=905 RepID=D2RNL5_ACIFV|nr:hypothetical protein Acfer_0233 [Acidaminococcus fermentans DSM 20731]SDW68893.1 hypothetical protein SAMN05216495_10479 [Acidaminococcus fermentans]SFO52628.1 hypothetical protein SAMN02910455_00822 [Acidaminococcus fermentans]
MPCVMNKAEKPTLRQKWRGFVEFLHRPKTRFDIRDRGRALVLFLLIVAGLMWVVEKITG